MRVQKINFATPGVTFKANDTRGREGKIIARSLEELKKIRFDNNDLIYMRSIGATPPFNSGLEAYEFIKNNNINIRFSKLQFNDAHASWEFSERAILINEKYKNSTSFPETLAIAAAIFHESGHAKDGDGENSIQEELDCLALNVLGHKYYKKTHKDVFLGQNSFLFSEGVSLYANLFYRFDPTKHQLKLRVAEKYGYLQPSSKGHIAGNFVKDVKEISQKGSVLS